MPRRFDEAVDGLQQGKISIERYRDILIQMVRDFQINKAVVGCDEILGNPKE